MKITALNRIRHTKVAVVKMTALDFDKLSAMLNNCGDVIRREYPVNQPAYDEDAGVFVDNNTLQAIYGFINMNSMLNAVILDADFPETEYQTNMTDEETTSAMDSKIGEVMFLHIGIPSLMHLLSTVRDEDALKMAIAETDGLKEDGAGNPEIRLFADKKWRKAMMEKLHKASESPKALFRQYGGLFQAAQEWEEE